MKNLPLLFLFMLLLFGKPNMTAQITLHTEDLPRFYQAFDSVLTTQDTVKQLDFINKLYVEKASKGLKEFMELRSGNAVEWRKLIIKDQQSLKEKRPWIMSVLNQKPIIEKKLERFKALYPDFREGDIYFCVGINNSGGTIRDKTVYIGVEVLAYDKENWALSTVLHEFTHTQQWTQRNILRMMSSDSLVKDYMSSHSLLLGRCLEEGMADFVSELVNEENLAKTEPSGHTAFGLKNEPVIWAMFKKEMLLPFDQNGGWLYSKRDINGEKVSDLGYFMGHQICKKYYENAKDKKKALKEMIELNMTDENAKQFLLSSGYISQAEMDALGKK